MIKILLALLFVVPVSAKTIRIAVIDSGISAQLPVKMCNTDSKDFTKTGLIDRQFHGTVVSNIIELEAKDTDYCQIMIKIFDPSEKKSDIKYIEALKYVLTLNQINVLNISAGGNGYSYDEDRLIKEITNNGVFVFVAAGNQNTNLDLNCNYYPACYRIHNLFMVGNLLQDGTRHPMSNYGQIVDLWFDGINPYTSGTGTSFSTAKASGKFVKYLDKLFNKKQ